MRRLVNIVLVASLGAGCGDYYGYYGPEFGTPVWDETVPVHDDLYYRDMYGWYYPYGGWAQPAPSPPPRERPQQRAPQAPLPPPREEPAPQPNGDAERREPK